MTKNETDINQVLLEPYDVPTATFDGMYTKTTQFLLPTIDFNVRNKIIFSHFENAFLDDRGIEHQFERPIFVLMKTASFKEKHWQDVFGALTKSPYYIFDYDIGVKDGKHLVMLVFRVPDQYANDYTHFKRGLYSHFSDDYKKKFPQYVENEQGQPQESIIWGVMHKSRTLKRMLEEEFGMRSGELDKPDVKEIWDKPRPEREYYRYEKPSE